MYTLNKNENKFNYIEMLLTVFCISDFFSFFLSSSFLEYRVIFDNLMVYFRKKEKKVYQPIKPKDFRDNVAVIYNVVQNLTQ